MKTKEINVSDELFTAFRDFVSLKMGLYFQDNKRKDLLRGVKNAADTFGYRDCKTCMNQLLARNWTDTQIQTLASYLTVGETHFYRHREHLNYFVEKIVKSREFIKRQSIRIWSAGCCTGDEAYTLAILFYENLPFADKYDISIYGSDINPVFLNKAKEGVFTKNSFRDTPVYIQKKYFKQIARDRFELVPKIKKMVNFRYLNLASNTYPLDGNNTTNFDVIFCRNVFIYFSNETVASICERFKKALKEGGCFFVSPAETFMVPKDLFNKDRYNKALIFTKGSLTDNKKDFTATGKYTFTKKTPSNNVRKTAKPSNTKISDNISKTAFSKIKKTSILKKSKNVLKKDSSPPEKKVKDRDLLQEKFEEAGKLYKKGKYNDAVYLFKQVINNEKNRTVKSRAFIEMAKIYSNLGNKEESLNCCEKAISEDKLNPMGYFYYASLLMETGNIPESIKYFRKTLYFDNNFVIAHFLLGNIYLNIGNRIESKKYFKNAENILAGMSSSKVIHNTDGMTAGGMRELIKNMAGNGVLQ